jgi:hypothetical protein
MMALESRATMNSLHATRPDPRVRGSVARAPELRKSSPRRAG